MVNLGLLHPTLPVGIIKELKDSVKRLIWIVHNIGKPTALIVFEEHITCNGHAWQIGLRFTNFLSIDRQNLNLQNLQLHLLYPDPQKKQGQTYSESPRIG
jgi:hypothetical protein